MGAPSFEVISEETERTVRYRVVPEWLAGLLRQHAARLGLPSHTHTPTPKEQD